MIEFVESLMKARYIKHIYIKYRLSETSPVSFDADLQMHVLELARKVQYKPIKRMGPHWLPFPYNTAIALSLCMFPNMESN